MSDYLLKFDSHIDKNFVVVINYFIAKKLYSLEDAVGIRREYSKGQDVTLKIPTLLIPEFDRYLTTL